jgi:hypothetical protein
MGWPRADPATLPVSYEFAQSAGSAGSKNNVLGMQVVASFGQLQQAFGH